MTNWYSFYSLRSM